MPLIGDAVIGVSALLVAFLIVRKTGLWVWATIIVWNALAIWDALSAFAIHLTNPWPEFFMIKMVGPIMFFVAAAMHLDIIVMACRPGIKNYFIGDAP